MKVNFQLTVGDHWRYRKYRMRHDWRYFPVRFLAIFLSGFLMGVLFNHDWALSIFMSCVVTPFYLLHAALTTKSEVRKRLDQYPYLLEPQTVVISASGVHWEGDFDATEIPWLQFVALEDNGEHVLLRLRDWYALVIPKRAFVDPSQSQEFFLNAHSFWQSAKIGGDTLNTSEALVWPPAPRIGV